MQLHPQGISGSWKSGIVLDWHTVGSQIVGQNEFGHPIFENTRSEIGELLYRFKYKNDQIALSEILKATIEYLGPKVSNRFDLVLPVPPSNPARTVTRQLAEGLANGFSTKYSNTALIKVKNTDELKSVTDPEIRKKMLSDAFHVEESQTEGRTILLVDDLYRSGATFEAATDIINLQGKAKAVYVLAITRTRVHR